MGLTFGVKQKDAHDREYSGNYLRSFKKGETLVRFLDETGEWIRYWEHHTTDGKSFPCTEDRESCPGCTHENEKVRRASKRYGVNLLLVKQGIVLPFKLPVTLYDRLVVRAERNDGTVTNRDYVIIKSGSGLDTEYDVDQEDKYSVDLAELHKKAYNIQEILGESYAEVWGDPDAPKAKDEPKSKGESKEEAKDVPPTEPAAKSESAGEAGEVEMTEASIRAMGKSELRALCTKVGLEFTEDDTSSELADKLIAAYGD